MPIVLKRNLGNLSQETQAREGAMPEIGTVI
jgi:hypothetical protein